MYYLEERMEMRDMMEIFKNIKGVNKVQESNIFNMVPRAITQGHDLYLN